MPELRLDSPLQFVKGVGPKKASVLSAHGLDTVLDILHYYPRHYLDRTNVMPIGQAALEQPVTVIGRVKAHGVLHGRRRRYEVILQDESGAISLLWFAGTRFWERFFKKDMVLAASGTPTYYMGRQMVHPDLERLDEESDKMIHAGGIVPVYPQTSELNKVGLSSKALRRIIATVLQNLGELLLEDVPLSVLGEHQLLSLNEAIRKIHFPDHREQVEQCRRRLAFGELLEYQYLIVESRRRRKAVTKGHKYAEPGDKLQQFRQALPFELTTGQKSAVREIFADLQRPQPMSRLLQGDVGSGKTVVAVAAALYVAENGLQTAFMAPTEILAEQHFHNWSARLGELGIACGLLTSSQKAALKKETARACAEGDLQILFGTHALISDYVRFQKLGLVVIDEQHRFGVQQRGKLHAKGDHPDLLAMTATPIPRTLTLTLYGDLDVATITGLPPGRKPIRTVWRSEEVRGKVYQFVLDEIAQGGQAYFIYPVIEKSEAMPLTSVEDSFSDLSEGPFRDLRLGMVHGRIKPKERDQTIQAFRDGELDILLATTVVEVGLDNPNATVMVIEHAERFGLAQLHQLRGRIGRGSRQATVVALAQDSLSEIAHHRLDFFAGTTDGFAISEADLELRGPGEIYGLRQSGLPELRLTRLQADQDLIQGARKLLEQLFEDKAAHGPVGQALLVDLAVKASSRTANLGGG